MSGRHRSRGSGPDAHGVEDAGAERRAYPGPRRLNPGSISTRPSAAAHQIEQARSCRPSGSREPGDAASLLRAAEQLCAGAASAQVSVLVLRARSASANAALAAPGLISRPEPGPQAPGSASVTTTISFGSIQ